MASGSISTSGQSESDVVIFLLVTLVIAVFVAGYLQKSTTTDIPRQRGREITTKKSTNGPTRTISVRAKALQKELALKLGSPVTLATEGILFRANNSSTTSTDTPASTYDFVPQALDALRLLLEFADVFLLAEAQEGRSGEATQRRVLASLERERLVRKDGTRDQEHGGQDGGTVAVHVGSFDVGRGDGCDGRPRMTQSSACAASSISLCWQQLPRCAQVLPHLSCIIACTLFGR